ncbi:conserved exported hypothetical protein [Candidatus Sulfopaludibacter sp. SbA4]|nr:conserved exported hypothetical protein [Candidatus Sulfopaludibacter sp. SbA4]
MKRIAWILIAASAGFSQAPSIDDIMGRVAANQAKSVEARKQFVYRQQELVAMHQSNGKMTCEQRREYTVTPMADGIERRLVNPPGTNGELRRCNVDLSGGSGENLSVTTGSEGDSFSTSLGKTKDGVPRGLFPLTAEEQQVYEYKLAGTEMHAGRKVYRVTFRPNQQKDASGNQGYWKGEALIDAEEFQPVQVNTDLTIGIPLPVRILLGTSVHGIGFTVSYRRLADGVWFPSGFGGEFSVRALFFFKQVVAINVTNSDFRHTDVNSTLTFDGK